MDDSLISAFNYSLDLKSLETLRRHPRQDEPAKQSRRSRNQHIIKMGEYRIEIDRSLGRGAFGEVFRGYNLQPKYWVAAKQVKLPDKSSQEEQMILDEIQSLRMLSGHENIITLYECFFDDVSTWLVMDFCDLGDMDSFFQTYKPNLTTCMKLACMCACAVSYMHNQSEPIVHRDIKPANILLKSNRHGEVIVKMTDFGLAKIIEHTTLSTQYMQTFCGTMAFMAPEIILQQKYTRSVDVFALGLVYLSMLQFEPGMKRLTPRPINIPGRERYSGNTPIAMLMVGAHDPKRGEERNSIPVLVKFSKKDNWIVRQLKHAVRDMTHYETKKRPTMMKIKQNLEAVIKDMVKQPLEEEEQQFYYEDDPMEYPDSNSDSDAELETVIQKINIGDTVRAITDVEEVKKRQEEMLGVWSNEVKPFLGIEGTVVRVTRSFVKVEYFEPEERKLTLHPSLVELCPRK